MESCGLREQLLVGCTASDTFGVLPQNRQVPYAPMLLSVFPFPSPSSHSAAHVSLLPTNLQHCLHGQ